MQRYNIFYQIHKGLRQMLYHTASLMQQTDFTNAGQTATLIAQIEEVLELFDGHANTEDKFVLPAIEVFEPSVVNLFGAEHAEDHALSNRLRTLLNMFHHAVSSEEKNEMGSAIRVAFTSFLVFNLTHMAKEENVLMNLLWKNYTDPALHGITVEIVANLAPEKLSKYNAWMMRALSNEEITGWLKMIQAEAPDFVFEAMLALAEKELSAGRFSFVQENIFAGAVFA